jgi:ClpP class serine protease
MWLLLQSVLQDMQDARSSGVKFTAEQIAQFNLEFAADDTSRLMAIAGDSAEIHVKGVLTNTPDMFARWFGGGNTTYPSIIAALAEADANPEVKQIVMRFDSGGGAVNGMFDAISAMQTTNKPIKGIVGTMAASAAFGLISQADEIVAHNRASAVGSIGVVVDAFVSDSLISITSSNAPDKRPDITTAKGKAVVVAQLDAIADLLDEAVAEGRNTTVKKVNADFGQGGILLADEALKRGMIDSIGSNNTKPATAKTGGKQQEKRSMDLTTLKAQNPDVYAAAAKEGQDKERDRVGAHLTMGEASGDMATAISAIGDGSAMTATLQAKYMAAGMNRADVQARKDDDAAAAAAADGAYATDADAEAAAGVNVLAMAAEACGVELGA